MSKFVFERGFAGDKEWLSIRIKKVTLKFDPSKADRTELITELEKIQVSLKSELDLLVHKCLEQIRQPTGVMNPKIDPSISPLAGYRE